MAKVCYRGRGNNTFRMDRKNSSISNSNSNARRATSSLHLDDKYDQVQPLVEEPVSFNFGDADYGNKLFLDLRKEMLMMTKLFIDLGKPRIHRTVKGFKYSDEEIYTFSSLEDVIDSFLF